ncbi:MAG: N-formylglutamate amidohydrolase [Proteobacteria bacterium]|nr:N-formylglutamate amidohydrolase [Pseudomonadota bacterium]MBU1742376.1 N-formylglutamate amidohydrolase [Pseudomonadota bacterium]
MPPEIWPVVISIPHGGGEVPADIGRTLAQDERQIRQAVDLGATEVFGPLPAAVVIMTRWSRFVVDLNRAEDQRDDKGVIARTDYFGRPVFLPNGEPDPAETERRLQSYYRPYHRRLAAALGSSGIKLLVEGHSLDGVGPPDAPDPGRTRPDVVLGNGGNSTCPASLLSALARAMERQGLATAQNYPYQGGYIPRHYGPEMMRRGGGALQIEINKDLYVDPDTQSVLPDQAAELRQRLRAALREVAGDW